MNEVIDHAWDNMLAGVLKKRHIYRPGLGDEIDLFIPQSRLLSLLETSPSIIPRIYGAARESARRNAGRITSSLGMPADYFWKFEYWPKVRAYTTLEKIVSRVFASIMKQSKTGELKLTELNIDPLVIEITFDNCAECAGIEGLGHNICYYHAGTFSGILSGLINRDLAGYESACRAGQGSNCRFIIFDRAENPDNPEFSKFMTPPVISTGLPARLEKSLKKISVRDMGNVVDICYLQLATGNTLVQEPENYSSLSHDTGTALGKKLAPVLAGFYGSNTKDVIRQYSLQLGEFKAEISGDSSVIEMSISECAEISGTAAPLEMAAFLSGELCGLISEFTRTEMVLKNSQFKGNNLLLTFVPAG